MAVLGFIWCISQNVAFRAFKRAYRVYPSRIFAEASVSIEDRNFLRLHKLQNAENQLSIEIKSYPKIKSKKGEAVVFADINIKECKHMLDEPMHSKCPANRANQNREILSKLKEISRIEVSLKTS